MQHVAASSLRRLLSACMLPLIMSGAHAETASKAAIDAIKANFPGMKVVDVDRETERGARYYEVNLTDGKRRFEVEVSPDGVIGEIEAVVSVHDLPPALFEKLRERVGRGRVVRVEKHERRGIARSGKFVPLDEPRISYEAKYVTARGDRREIQLDSNEILELPDKVLASLQATFPGTEIDEVEVEDDGGILLYVVELEAADDDDDGDDDDDRHGRRHDDDDDDDGEMEGPLWVVLTRDGVIIEKETPVKARDYPKAIARAMKDDREIRRADKVRLTKRLTAGVVEKGRLVARRDMVYVLQIFRGGRTREYQFDGRGKLKRKSDWEDGWYDDDDDDDDD